MSKKPLGLRMGLPTRAGATKAQLHISNVNNLGLSDWNCIGNGNGIGSTKEAGDSKEGKCNLHFDKQEVGFS